MFEELVTTSSDAVLVDAITDATRAEAAAAARRFAAIAELTDRDRSDHRWRRHPGPAAGRTGPHGRGRETRTRPRHLGRRIRLPALDAAGPLRPYQGHDVLPTRL
jgi:hypothetical protein